MKRLEGKGWGWQGLEWWEGMRAAVNFRRYRELIWEEQEAIDSVVADDEITTVAAEDVEAIEEIDGDLDEELAGAGEHRSSVIVERHLNFKLALSAIVSALLICGSLPRILGREIAWVPQWLQLPIWQLLVTTILVVSCIGSIFRRDGGVRDLARAASPVGNPWQWQVNDGIAPSTIAAFILAILGTIAPELFERTYLYYQVVAIIITLNLSGRKLHQRAIERALIATPELDCPQPEVARIIENDREISVPIERVQVGDIVSIYPGEVVPIDGIIIGGEAKIDESMLTGDRICPVTKTVGDNIFSGTVCQTASLHIRSTCSGEDTSLLQLDREIERLKSERVFIPSMADRATAYLLPISIGMACLTTLVWLFVTHDLAKALTAGLGLFIVACPHTLPAIATIATSIGINKSTRRQIFIHDEWSLLRLQRVETIACDRAGVLTGGKPVVTDFIPVIDRGRSNEWTIFQLAASLENRAIHPLTSAIVDRAKERQLVLKPVERFQYLTERGMSGIIDGKLVRLGTGQWITSFDATEIFPTANHQIFTNYQCQWQADGKNVVWLAIDRQIAGIIGISDAIHPLTISTVERLKKLGFAVVLLDRKRVPVVEKFAQTIGIDRLCYAAEPLQRAATIGTLQARSADNLGAIVAAIGNGTNHAPAIASADVGIAMGTSVYSAVLASDIVISSGEPSDILQLIKIARSTVNHIRQNLFFIAIFQLAATIISTGIFFPLFSWSADPAIAVCLLVVSAIVISVNSWRSQRQK